MSATPVIPPAVVTGWWATAPMPFTDRQRALLLQIARQSIEHGLRYGVPLNVDTRQFDQRLTDNGACFVTLHQDGQLRGCIGSLEARRPLIEDVAENAFAAAFRDPRFKPLQHDELIDLCIDISLIHPPQSLPVSSEQQLLKELQPAIDGLILEDGRHRGTFLPSVWESLPEPAEFIRQLKRKAGLPVDYWSDTLKVWRYTTECFGERDDRRRTSS